MPKNGQYAGEILLIGQCYYCGIDVFKRYGPKRKNGFVKRLLGKKNDHTIDHKIPLALGGKNGANAVDCCANCNIVKGAMTDIEFMALSSNHKSTCQS